ncbi:hypothetical protein CYMTET_13464 [Cymbomonas tetramitiformis]|uniref:Uncharacterized protein n=1 Tax=Cymbomonas tetramitiformis TaxID=36881 RepID=A0AAE0GI35_9CHLO|nr:hypothetical protein CYMTET_13464 [Cymbomonas tetramitiformis]
MNNGGFTGFPYVLHRAINPNHSNDKPDRSMIQGAIKFTYDDKQDCGVIGVSFAKRCYHHEAQSTPISAAGRAEANGTESSEMRVAKRRAETVAREFRAMSRAAKSRRFFEA